MNRSSIFLLAFLFLSLTIIYGQDAQVALTAKEKQVIVDSISQKLLSTYVFPKVAQQMTDAIQSNIRKGAYQAINDPFDFANQLAEDLIAVSNDKHIIVEYHPPRAPARIQPPSPEEREKNRSRRMAQLKRENFGFKELKILEGNIGYLDLRSFADVDFAGPTAVSAMNFLSSSEAIIIDLRMNTGGSPAMIQLISSYLFPSSPVHLNTFYWRPADRHTQTWTLPHVEGNRSVRTPVYILTSKRTFSAAEEFSYNLKHMQRATLIGETTGGGAHPTGPVQATEQFTIWVPSGRAINPITQTNWEGIGVKPHIEVPAKEALEAAHVKALESLLEDNEDPELERYYEWHLSGLKSSITPVKVPSGILASYTGSYGPRRVFVEGSTLYYQRDDNRRYQLIPVSQHEFALEDSPSFRLRFLKEKDKVVALEMYSDSGYSDRNTKNED